MRIKKIYKLIKRKFLKRTYSNISHLGNIPFDPPSIWIEKILTKNNIFIVQVGSNDGITGDPLHSLILKNKDWNVLFIEPVPTLFENLIRNYPDQERFKFENVAINDGSFQIFYSVHNSAKTELPELPSWFDQLSSFKRENITNHLNGILEPYIEEINIQGVTLPFILSKNHIQNIDLLHIDVEGYDWLVLSQLDLKKYFPKIILYEHKHLSLDEKKESLKYLKKYNYSVFQLGADFIAIKSIKKDKKIVNTLKGQKII